jgi:fumarylacetoacetase
MTRAAIFEVPPGSDFPLENLPYGVFRHGAGSPRVGIAIGAHVLDLAEVAAAGLLANALPDAEATFTAGTLNAFLGHGRPVWLATRRRITELLSEGNLELARAGLNDTAFVPQAEVELLLPIAPGDYIDFYSSIEHATNLGRLFRPEGEPLLPNWRYLPVAYHGRSSTVVASGTPIVRPQGQIKPPDAAQPIFTATRRLDFELEVGFVTGPSNALGEPIPTARAHEHVFGLVLVNDWSARDIQAWEYQPLGPFLGKSFATSVSPWVVPLDALAPYMVPAPPQDPVPLDYLRVSGNWAIDLQLEVDLRPAGGREASTISRTNFRDMYWTIPQQLAHVTVNGTQIRPGDLYASGTVSGAEPGSEGSLIELTRGGAEPLTLPGGVQRAFLQDGDTVVLRGWCGGDGGRPRIGFGEVRGTVEPAPER